MASVKGKREAKTAAPVSAPRARVLKAAEELAETREKALEMRALGGSMTRCGAHAGVARHVVQGWVDRDPDFSARWREATEAMADRLEDVATMLGTIGHKRPIYQRGELVGHETIVNTNLLLANLARLRGEWSKTRIEFTGKDGGPIQLQAVRERLAEKLEALAAPNDDE